MLCQSGIDIDFYFEYEALTSLNTLVLYISVNKTYKYYCTMTYFDISPNLERIVIVSLDYPAQASKLVLYALSDVRC